MLPGRAFSPRFHVYGSVEDVLAEALERGFEIRWEL
jgi:hypothetical protein